VIRFRPAAAKELAADVRRYDDIRSAKVDRFPYRIVYLVIGEDVDVVAVAHAKRRPAYWRRRV